MRQRAVETPLDTKAWVRLSAGCRPDRTAEMSRARADMEG